MKKMICIYVVLLGVLTSCDDVFEKDIEYSKVEVVTPQNNATVSIGEVSFLWNRLRGARGYHLTIVSPSFRNASKLIADTVLWADSVSEKLKYTHLMGSGRYQWNIRGLNDAYTSSNHILDLFVLDDKDLSE